MAKLGILDRQDYSIEKVFDISQDVMDEKLKKDSILDQLKKELSEQ